MTLQKTRIVLPIAFRPFSIGAGHEDRSPPTWQHPLGFTYRMHQLGQPPDCFSIDTPSKATIDSRPTAPNAHSLLTEPRL